MLELRHYQRESIDALYEYWAEDRSGNGLIVLPTGAGKALVIAKIIEELLAGYPDIRILNVTHSGTLVEQNFKEFLGLCPGAPAGIYSAGLGRKDRRAQVLFCSIQSVANKVESLGHIDLVIVDEAHAISRKADTLYGKFFAAVRQANPDSRVCGLTATDYRMDSGRLTEGDDRLFDKVVYESTIRELIDQGFLTRLSTKRTDTSIDLTGVGTRGGEYIPGELARAADKEEITKAAVAEAVKWSDGRKAALFFCSGQDHADHVRDEVRRQGETCESLTSRTPDAERSRILAEFRAGELWSLASANMLTTGANFPHVDLISLIRSTKSAGLLVQMLGRGTRNFPGKRDCLVLDHGKNLAYHGPIDLIEPRTPGKGGEAPIKLCPDCDELMPISLMVCPCCGHEFPPSEDVKITPKADLAPVLSNDEPNWLPVMDRTFAEHVSAKNGLLSVKVTYGVEGGKAYSMWVCPQHRGRAKANADRWWNEHGGSRPFPKTVDEFLTRVEAGELLVTTHITIKRAEGTRFWNPDRERVGEERDSTYTKPTARTGDIASAMARPRWGDPPKRTLDWEDDIPF